MAGNRNVRLALSALGLWLVASVAQASPAEVKRACVAASTQGQTERDAGNLLEARRELLMCARDECPPVVRKSCTGWLADVEERIPSVVVRVLDPYGADLTDAELSIDGEPAQLDGRPVPLNPGPHTLVVTDTNGRTTERKVLLAEKETGRLISVQLQDDDEASSGEGPEPMRMGGSVSTRPRRDTREGEGFRVPVGVWVLGGVGVAGLAGFTYFGIAAKNELDDLKKTCGNTCTSDQTADGKRSALIADISLGVGAAALVGAGTWAILAFRKHKQKDRAKLSLVPTREGVMAGFHTRF